MNCGVGEVTESLESEQNSFSNPSVASPTSQLILQPFFRLSYVTRFSLASPGEPPMKKPYINNLFHRIVRKNVIYHTAKFHYCRYNSFWEKCILKMQKNVSYGKHVDYRSKTMAREAI